MISSRRKAPLPNMALKPSAISPNDNLSANDSNRLKSNINAFKAMAGEVIPANDLVWTPQPGPQTLFLTCPIADILFGGSRGGGKTDALLGHFMAHQAMYGSKAKGLLLRRSYDELEEVVIRSKVLFARIGAIYLASKHRWHFKSGATLRLRYLERDEDAERYQGHSYSWIGVDEMSAFPSPSPIDKIRACLRSVHPEVKCQFLQTANPGGRGHNWIKERYHLGKAGKYKPYEPFFDEERHIQRVYIPSRLSDNRFLSYNDDYKNRLRSSGPSWLVKAWLEGDWDSNIQGNTLKADWFRIHSFDHTNAFEEIIQSWDMSFKKTEGNSYVVGQVWGRNGVDCYLLDQVRRNMGFVDTLAAVVAMKERWPHTGYILIEDKANGPAVIDALESRIVGIMPITPRGSKEARLHAVTPRIETGHVFIPRSMDHLWVPDYLAEMTAFPFSPDDDQVDATSQALSYFPDLDMTGMSETGEIAYNISETMTENFSHGRHTPDVQTDDGISVVTYGGREMW